jgi:hypothetical protein
MLDRSNLVVRGRSEHTKRRQQIGILLKKSMKGDGKAKLKLYKEFGIKLYSSGEIDKYVQEGVSKEYASGGRSVTLSSPVVTRETRLKGISKNGGEQSRSKNSASRAKLRDKTRKLVKKV